MNPATWDDMIQIMAAIVAIAGYIRARLEAKASNGGPAA